LYALGLLRVKVGRTWLVDNYVTPSESAVMAATQSKRAVGVG
jgi:hypothetical protein